MGKLCTSENHSYKHNEQINKQNIDNSECFGVKFVKIYPEMEGCVTDLNSKINRICLSSCMNKSKDL
jgi:hypothetical protein